VLRRPAGRVLYELTNKASFAALARTISAGVMPATLLAWHRKLAASKRRKAGARRWSRGIARLAARLAQENPP
jgi:hypothetical protein